MARKDVGGVESAFTLLLKEAASASAKGDCDLAEALYKQALRKAEGKTEPQIFVLRKILSDFIAFYEKTGKDNLAAGLRKRMEEQFPVAR